MGKNYLTVVYEMDEKTSVQEILDAHPWALCSHTHAVYELTAARLEIAKLKTQEEAVAQAVAAERDAVRSVYSRSMDLVRTFWQQHTKSDALSMTMAELHDDAERVIRAALAAPAQPVTWPRNAAEVREFMDAHCQREERANDDSSPSDDDLYALTAYDFLSAVSSWADSPHHPGATQPAAQAKEYAKGAERYRLLNLGVDVIQADDEFLSNDTATWATDPNGVFVGLPYQGYALLPARRKLNDAIAAQQGGA